MSPSRPVDIPALPEAESLPRAVGVHDALKRHEIHVLRQAGLTLQDPEERSTFIEPVELGVATILATLEWSGPLCSRFVASLRVGAGSAAVASASPLRLRLDINATRAAGSSTLDVRPANREDADYVSVCYRQAFDVYTTLYYNEPAPAGATGK